MPNVLAIWRVIRGTFPSPFSFLPLKKTQADAKEQLNDEGHLETTPLSRYDLHQTSLKGNRKRDII